MLADLGMHRAGVEDALLWRRPFAIMPVVQTWMMGAPSI
jgi:hypothetical protein